MIAFLGIVSGTLLLLAFGFFARKGELLSWIYDVQITECSIEFVLFSKVTFYRLPFSNIEKIVEGRGGISFWTATDFRNRFFGGSLLIFKRTGVFTRKVLISPASYDAFIHTLKKGGVDVSTAET